MNKEKKHDIKIFGNEELISKKFNLKFTTEQSFYNYIISQIKDKKIETIPFDIKAYYDGEIKEVQNNDRLLTSNNFIKNFQHMLDNNSLPDIYITHINKNIGYGVKNGKKKIKAGTPLGFYAGLFVHRDSPHNGYLMDCADIYNEYIFDGKKGNWTSKINHSLIPNLRAIPIYTEEIIDNKKNPIARIGFETIKDILPGKALSFYYSDSSAFNIEYAYICYYNYKNEYHNINIHMKNIKKIINTGYKPDKNSLNKIIEIENIIKKEVGKTNLF